MQNGYYISTREGKKSITAELHARAKRAKQSPLAKKIRLSIHPRNFSS